MLAATKVKMSGGVKKKKVNRNTYNIFLHKTCNEEVTGSFTFSSCKRKAKKCTKKVSCKCKVVFYTRVFYTRLNTSAVRERCTLNHQVGCSVTKGVPILP